MQPCWAEELSYKNMKQSNQPQTSYTVYSYNGRHISVLYTGVKPRTWTHQWITWSGLYSSLLINQSSLWISERDTTSRLMASGRNLQQQLSLKLTEIALKPVSQPSPKPRNLRPAAVMSCHYTLLDAPNDRTQKTQHTKTLPSPPPAFPLPDRQIRVQKL